MEGTKVSEEALNKALAVLGFKKGQESAPIVQPAVDSEKEKLETELADTLKKAEDIKSKLSAPATQTITPEAGASDEIVKALESKIEALGTVVLHKTEKEAELQKAVDTLTASLTEIKASITELGKQPLDRKSVTPGTAA